MDINSDATPEEIVHRSMNKLRGRLCGFFEACGLPERQERAAIQTLKSLTYDSELIFVELVNELEQQY